MTDTTYVPVTAREQAYLSRVRLQAKNVRQAAESLRRTGERIVENLDAGETWRLGLSHQLPKDFWDAQAKLDTYLEMQHAVLSVEVLNSDVLDQVIRSDDDAILYRLTKVVE